MIKKIINKLRNIKKKFFKDINEFNFKIAFINLFSALYNCFSRNTESNKLMKKKHAIINKFLEKDFSNLILKYKYKNLYNEKSKKAKKYIWCFWYQNWEEAPKLVQKCNKQLNNILEKDTSEYKLIMLSKDNYSDYVQIPKFILKKVEDQKITLTHFSDILRVALLSKYGGIWVDSTLLFRKDIFENFDNKAFNSSIEKDSNNLLVKGRWTGFFMGGTPNNLFQFIYDFFLEYHKKYNHLIDYFLIDYAINIAYNNFEYAKKIIDDADIYNSNLYLLQNSFASKYDNEKYNKIIKSADFFKLSYKGKLREFTTNKKLSNYGFFIK